MAAMVMDMGTTTAVLTIMDHTNTEEASSPTKISTQNPLLMTTNTYI